MRTINPSGGIDLLFWCHRSGGQRDEGTVLRRQVKRDILLLLQLVDAEAHGKAGEGDELVLVHVFLLRPKAALKLCAQRDIVVDECPCNTDVGTADVIDHDVQVLVVGEPALIDAEVPENEVRRVRRVRTIGLHGFDELLTLVMERERIACAAQGGRGGTRWKGVAGREGAHGSGKG